MKSPMRTLPEALRLVIFTSAILIGGAAPPPADDFQAGYREAYENAGDDSQSNVAQLQDAVAVSLRTRRASGPGSLQSQAMMMVDTALVRIGKAVRCPKPAAKQAALIDSVANVWRETFAGHSLAPRLNGDLTGLVLGMTRRKGTACLCQHDRATIVRACSPS